jgi:hypothetical protein
MKFRVGLRKVLARKMTKISFWEPNILSNDPKAELQRDPVFTQRS